MAQTIKPLQIACSQQVLEQNNEFFLIVSATMGVRLSTGEVLLEFDFYKEAFEHIGDNPLPDMGMPKPQGEYVVSGSFYAPGGQAVTGGEVRVKLGHNEKNLVVFGEREWVMGVPSEPDKITSLPLLYSNAYGGQNYQLNPDGIGFNETKLPLIENPAQILTSNKQNIPPAGFAPLNPSWPQRMQYQGTFDDSYLEKYFPGYPVDHDWRFFMTTAQDQWQDEYFQGNEAFELENLHPDQSSISGRLPGYRTRCFLNQQQSFKELSLNLDTLWFFPETDLALLIWRGVKQVEDDDASSVADILLGYEAARDEPRSVDYYQAALDKRKSSDDLLLNNFNTSDLIPSGAKCAMELLQEQALIDSGESPFAENMDAKVVAVQALVDEKTAEINQQIEDNLTIPQELSEAERTSIEQQIDLKEVLSRKTEIKPDAETDALKAKLEAILPGITAGDAKKLSLKDFSFAKVDELMEAVDQYTDSKEAQALQEIDKARKEVVQQTADQMEEMQGLPAEEEEKIKAQLDAALNPELPNEPPMPRMRLEELEQDMSRLSPEISEAMQQVETMKALGADDGAVIDAQKIVTDMLDQQQSDLSDMMQSAGDDFKEVYIMGAHTQPRCTTPHQEDHELVVEKLLQRIRSNQDVSGMDWACLDLSGKVLDGVDFSGAYLEQVDFSNASLKGCNFKGAILARATLNGADCSGASFDQANLGAVVAHRADFSAASFRETILSNSDFGYSKFHSTHLENVQSLEIKIGGADFSGSSMEAMKFIELELNKVKFTDAALTGSVFMHCDINNCDFSGANLQSCVWGNSSLSATRFDRADMTSVSFTVTEGESVKLEGLSFRESRLQKANFQNLCLPGSDFRKADISCANFGNADVRQSDFSSCDGRQALFRKAALSHCNFEQANIMEGIMSKANMSGASFNGANLYAVDFLRSTMGDTDFSGANLDNTIIRDWRPA